MKKLISLALALVMILSLATVAFAATESGYAAADAKTVTLKKAYTVTGGTAYPSENLTFTSTAAEGNPDTSNLTIDEITTGTASTDITVTTPAYTKVGVYNYTITETAGKAQGVTYSSAALGIKVVVTYGDDEKLVATPVLTTVKSTNEDGTKVKEDTFTNTFAQGSLEVKKTISGNLASDTNEFSIKVKFSTKDGKYVYSDIAYTEGSNSKKIEAGQGWTGEKEVTIKLKADETVTFTDIPIGMTYTVTEDDQHAKVDANGSDGSKGYTVTYTGGSGTINAGETAAAVVNNDKGATSDTGIVLDSMPYIILLTLAAAGMFVLLTKKRAREF